MIEEARTEFVREPENQPDARTWYVASSDGQHQGPFELGELQRRARQCELDANTHVWREGLSEWRRLSEVAETGSTTSQPLLPPKAPDKTSHGGRAGLSAQVTQPRRLRCLGRGSGAAGAVLALASLGGSLFGWSWFTGSLLLLLAFPVFESLAELLEHKPDRHEAQASEEPHPLR